MSWKDEKRKCAADGCATEFYPGDPRQQLCSKHHFLMLANMGARVSAGESPLEVVAEEMVRAGLGKSGGT